MKIRILFVVGVMLLVLLLPACGGNTDAPDAANAPSNASSGASRQTVDNEEVAGEMPALVNTMEYTLYQNIFFNKLTSDYSGQEAVKKGTFATLHDAFNNVTRYYVWGYNDWTKCCDWQWELKIDDTTDLPANGSLVQVKGVYEENDDALDNFWIIHPEITVETPFDERDVDIDMQSMDNTLERVQAANIVRQPDAFEGKTVCCYGRILDKNTLQDPYYDGSWTIEIAGDYEVPAFGTLVLLSGTVRSGGIADCEILPNTQY